MPEGPEIRRAADRIGKALVGKVVEDGTWPFPSLQQADSLILGHEVLSVTSRAKAMLIRFSSGYTMYSHNQLYGRWTVHLKTTDPKSNRSLRAEFITDKHAVRLWSATDIVLLPTPEENGHPFLARLGPDVLDESISKDDLLKHLKSKGIRRKKVATLKLDQRTFSGLATLERWASRIKSVTVQAYEHGGITVDLDTAEASKARGEPRRMWRHAVFCRNDRPCLTCGDLVVRVRYGGRRLDYCPTCQPARRGS